MAREPGNHEHRLRLSYDQLVFIDSGPGPPGHPGMTIRATRTRYFSPPRPGGSTRHQTAVDVVSLPGDVTRRGRCEEHGHCGNILGLVGAADRDPGLLFGLQLRDRDAA